MITLKKKNSLIVLFSSFTLVGFALLALDLFVGTTYVGSMTAAALIGAGVGGLFSIIAIFKRYSKFFEQEREATISEVASEVGRTRKEVISDLSMFTTNKKDSMHLHNCVDIKFVKK